MSKFVALVIKQLLPWLKDSLVGWFNKWNGRRKKRAEITSEVKRIEKAAKAISGKASPEQEKELVDAARKLIDIDSL